MNPFSSETWHQLYSQHIVERDERLVALPCARPGEQPWVLLDLGARSTWRPAANYYTSLFGPADDGGYWAIGLREPHGALVSGVPMSRADTGAQQLARLAAAGLRVAHLPALRDIDTAADLAPAAARAPRLAAALAGLASERLNLPRTALLAGGSQ